MHHFQSYNSTIKKIPSIPEVLLYHIKHLKPFISNHVKLHHKQYQAENNNLTHTSLCPNLRRLVPKFIARLPKRLMKAPTTHSPMNKRRCTAKDTPHAAQNFPPLPNTSYPSNSSHKYKPKLKYQYRRFCSRSRNHQLNQFQYNTIIILKH